MFNALLGEAEDSKSEEKQSQAGAFSLFDFAKDLATTVQQQSSEIANSVAVTDWGKEIRDFGSALKEDTQAVVAETSTLSFNPEQPGLGFSNAGENVQESIEVLGNQLEDFGRKIFTGTSDLLNQVTSTVQQEMAVASAQHNKKMRDARKGNKDAPNEKQAKYRAKVSAMQRDSSTYCDEPEDMHYFNLWKETFHLDAHKEEIKSVLKGNAFMMELQNRIVPLIVDHNTFWTQYFFRLHCIQVEEGMAEIKQASAQDSEGEATETEVKSIPSNEEQVQVEPIAEEQKEAISPKASAAELELEAKFQEEKQHEEKQHKDPIVVQDDKADTDDAISPREGIKAVLVRREIRTSEDEPDAATASDSSANEWVAVKTKSPETPVSTITENSPSNSPLNEIEEKSEDAKIEVSPIISPTVASKSAAINDDEIDEDWGEI